SISSHSFFLVIRPHPRSTLFPYTTLFRSSERQPERNDTRMSTRFRTWILVAGLSALFVGLGGLVGGTGGLVAFLLIAVVFNFVRSEEHTSELQSRFDLVCRLLLEKKKK